MKRALRIVLPITFGLPALLYVGDYLSLALQIPKRPQFGTIRMQPYLAVPRKDGRMEFMLEDAFEQTCVHSLFPHFRSSPCWYLQRERSRRKNL